MIRKIVRAFKKTLFYNKRKDLKKQARPSRDKVVRTPAEEKFGIDTSIS
ncbi:MAG TPA: hypothetical protein VNJ08_07860 [Bacteriovoracaceae bacterium]|nr:hypothetical protein [Bacteriovoracaceae bacterium]